MGLPVHCISTDINGPTVSCETGPFSILGGLFLSVVKALCCVGITVSYGRADGYSNSVGVDCVLAQSCSATVLCFDLCFFEPQLSSFSLYSLNFLTLEVLILFSLPGLCMLGRA